MYARITTVAAATAIGEGVDHLREEVVPQLQEQHGFKGLTASCDRAAGIVTVLTLWETSDDLDASDSAVEKVRKDAAAAFGGTIQSVDRYEQTVADIGANPPGPGSVLHLRQIHMDPATVDDNLEFFKSTVAPEIKASPGYQSLRQMINRETGDGIVGTVWVDQESLTAALASREDRRSQAASRGVHFGDDSTREVLFAAL